MASSAQGGGGDGPRMGVPAVSLIAGLALILLGILFLAGQFLRIDIGGLLWPFLIILPGAAMFLAALLSGPGGEPLLYPGSIVGMVGLILLYQNLTGHWSSWAYAWALIAPTSIGLGQVVYGALKGRGELVKSGLSLAGVGIVIFLVAAAFFELVLGMSGFSLGAMGFPLFLIGLGILILAANLIRAVRGK